jgi:hypothetical protein
MSSLQHISKTSGWTRVGRVFVVVVVALAVAATVAIVVGTSGRTPQPPAHTHLSAAQRQAQLGAYGGPRTGMTRPGVSGPGASTPAQPQHQLEAAAGPGYGQQLGFQMRDYAKRLMGLESTTFCMASSG